MSLRARLLLILVIPVLVPLAALAAVTLVLAEQAPEGKADAALATGQRAVRATLADLRAQATAAARSAAADRRLAEATRHGDRAAIRARAEQLRRRLGLARLDVVPAGGEPVRAGAAHAVAPTRVIVQERGGGALGEVVAWPVDAAALAARGRRLTGLDVVVRQGAERASTLPAAAALDPPRAPATVATGGEQRRAATTTTPGPPPLQVVLLASLDDGNVATLAPALVAALLLALAGVGLAARMLLGQVGVVLAAARRIGDGDLDTRVPVRGRDAFAALAVEFNRMAVRLRSRLDELGRERRRLDTAVRRVGDSLASGLDADSALAVAVRQAVDALGADAGRASEHDGQGIVARASAGSAGEHEALLVRAEAAALGGGEEVEASAGGAVALAHPLRVDEGDPTAVLAIVREGEPFGEDEKRLFAHLAEGAGRTLHNVERLEQATWQASTDELTRLANHRRFQEVMAAEIERSRRFDQPLGLVLLDIDDFKRVNDLHGHQRGDDVLRAVAQAVRDCTREIDEPARYGGEELVVALPQTDLAGAAELAERMRRAIEELDLSLDGAAPLRVTASFGVAAYPVSAGDRHSLVAAADQALYEAKRGGKNRVVQAR